MFSALPPKADVAQCGWHVRLVPISDIIRLTDPRAVVTVPTRHERPEILDRGSRGRNKRESLVLVCGGTEMVAGTATRLEKLFAMLAMLTGFEDEKAPLFGLSRGCRDNNPAFPRICGDCQA